MFSGRKPRKSARKQGGGTAVTASHSIDIESIEVTDKEASTDSAFVRFCVTLNVLNQSVAAVAMLCTLILAAYTWDSVIQLSLHAYTGCFLAAVMAAECERKWFFRRVPFLEGWILRGLFFIFVGVLLKAGVLLAGESAHTIAGSLVVGNRLTSSYFMGMGSLYFVMGVLCFKQLKAWQMRKVKRKKLMKAEMDSLTKQKDEIERLLVDTEKKMEQL